MAARSLTEIVQIVIHTPLFKIEQTLRGELRDFLAHEVARFCKKHDAMKHYDILAQFVYEVVKDLPVHPVVETKPISQAATLLDRGDK